MLIHGPAQNFVNAHDAFFQLGRRRVHVRIKGRVQFRKRRGEQVVHPRRRWFLAGSVGRGVGRKIAVGHAQAQQVQPARGQGVKQPAAQDKHQGKSADKRHPGIPGRAFVPPGPSFGRGFVFVGGRARFIGNTAVRGGFTNLRPLAHIFGRYAFFNCGFAFA